MVTVITILNHVTSRGISDSLTFPHLQEQHHLQCKHYPLVLNMQLKIGFCRHFKGHNFHGIFFLSIFHRSFISTFDYKSPPACSCVFATFGGFCCLAVVITNSKHQLREEGIDSFCPLWLYTVVRKIGYFALRSNQLVSFNSCTL